MHTKWPEIEQFGIAIRGSNRTDLRSAAPDLPCRIPAARARGALRGPVAAAAAANWSLASRRAGAVCRSPTMDDPDSTQVAILGCSGAISYLMLNCWCWCWFENADLLPIRKRLLILIRPVRKKIAPFRCFLDNGNVFKSISINVYSVIRSDLSYY